MVIARYDPFMQLRHQLFHQHFHEPVDGADEIRGATATWSPLVDIFEDKEGITLKVELPEVDANDVEIQLEGNALTLRGERKLENADKREDYHRIERYYGSFSRSFTLPSTVELGTITAQSRDGAGPRRRAAHLPAQEERDEASPDQGGGRFDSRRGREAEGMTSAAGTQRSLRPGRFQRG